MIFKQVQIVKHNYLKVNFQCVVVFCSDAIDETSLESIKILTAIKIVHSHYK